MVISDVKHAVRKRFGPLVRAIRPKRIDIPPSTWGLSVTSDGKLRHGSTDLASLTSKYGSPLHVVDAERVDDEASMAVASTDGRVFASYSLVPSLAVADRIHRQGVGVTVRSAHELALATSLGISPTDIIYAESAPTGVDLAAAASGELSSVVASTPSVARQLVALTASTGPIAVGLGIDLDGPAESLGSFGHVSPDFRETVRVMSECPLIELSALRVEIDPLVSTGAELDRVARRLTDLVQQIRDETSWQVPELVLATDLRCPTVAPLSAFATRLNRTFAADLLPPSSGTTLGLADAISSMREQFAMSSGASSSTRLSWEPGSALTQASQFTLTTILDKKSDGDVTHVILDAGINLAAPTMTEYHQLFNATSHGPSANASARLVGPICTPADVLYTNWRLPRIEVGDVLAIMDTGAGFVNRSTSFSFPRPAIVMLDGDQVSVIRRAETFDDLVRLDEMP